MSVVANKSLHFNEQSLLNDFGIHANVSPTETSLDRLTNASTQQTSLLTALANEAGNPGATPTSMQALANTFQNTNFASVLALVFAVNYSAAQEAKDQTHYDRPEL